MGLFDFLKRPDINAGLQEYKNTVGAVLLDVRTREEYAQGHIPGSRNLPLQEINTAVSLLPEQSTPIFVYCYSGARSAQATAYLNRMNYTSVQNLGGIAAYTGEVEFG